MSLILYKFILSIIVVVGLTFVAENVSTKWAGILSGLPTGTAITLYFYALEHGEKFAGESALHNMIGLVAMQTFFYAYYIGSKFSSNNNLLFPAICGFTGYLLCIGILYQFSFHVAFALIVPLLSFLLFKKLFKQIDNRNIKNKIKPSFKIIFFRALIAAFIIFAITSVAKNVGSEWAGLFSAFPTTVFPLLIIIHLTYGKKYVYSIIKYIPDGLTGLLLYSLSLYVTYHFLNIYQGIVLSFLIVGIYLYLYQIITKKKGTLN